jgi:hypothetical protein
MSKRFGRNQRRRLRAQVAAQDKTLGELDGALTMAQGLLREHSRSLAEQRAFFAAVARLVGQQSVIAGTQPQRLLGHAPLRDRFFIEPYSPLAALSVSPDAGPQEIARARYEVLRLLETSAVQDVFSRALHLRAHLADQSVGYAISETALAILSHEDLVAQVLPHMAQLLVKQIKDAVPAWRR